MEDILGFNGTKEETLKIWQKNAERWFSVGPPWRPSAGDIEIYKNLCGGKISGDVLILGSTSELRDLVALENNHPVLVDISPAMLQKMGGLTKYTNSAEEIWIKSDWCEAPLPKNHFDLVLGDMVWWVVSVAYQFKLRDKIASILKPNGLFVSRFRVFNEENKTLKPETVVEEYLEKFDNRPENEILLRNAMMSRLYDSFTDMATKRLIRKKTKSFLLEFLRDTTNPKHRSFLSEAAGLLLSADWTSQTRKEIMAIIERKFVLKKELSAKDYDAKFYPVMQMAKK